MNNRPLKLFGITALVAGFLVSAACSSTSNTGTGGNGGAGSGTGGMGVVGGMGGDVNNPGTCTTGVPNPDYTNPNGACAPDCQSVSCSQTMNRPCTLDCCVTCGIDQWGSKQCTCPNPGGPYNNCSCPAPSFITAGLHGGTCTPVGSSLPSTQVTNSLRFVPCSTANLVCFTMDSNPSSERGCVCRDDGIGNGGAGNGLFLHCGSVNHWFINDGTTTVYTP
jgi:hypothetical protein